MSSLVARIGRLNHANIREAGGRTPLVKESGRGAILAHALEIATNCATLIVALLLTAVLVRSYLRPSPPAPPENARFVNPADLVTNGTDMSKRISGVNWRANRRTLVLVLSTRCHFCTESAPFFRHLKERAGNGVKFLAVLPQPVAESERYLSGEGLHFDEVRQVPVEKTGAVGTPTMLLANQDGIVRRSWVGKLTPDKQTEALNTILDARFSGSVGKIGAVSEVRR